MPPAEGGSQFRDPGSNPGGKGAFCPQAKGHNNSACTKALGRVMTVEQSTKGVSPGPSSFCIPRSALDALLDAKATAYEICAYVVLAKFTDESGRYSTASITAVNTYTGANKTKGGPVDRAIERLKTIRAKSKQMVSNGRSSRHATQQGQDCFSHKVAAVVFAVVGALGVKLPAIFGHQAHADQVGPDKRGELRVKEDEHQVLQTFLQTFA